MGGKSERVSGTEKPLEDIANGKTVELQIEIWSSWGYGGKKSQCETLIKAVAKEGYVVNYTIEPKHGVNGEFFVYKVDGEKKTVVFSNSEEHKDSATVDYSINKKNMDDIVKKITG